MTKIGIGITTHNRYDVFSKTLAEIKRLAPAGAEIVVVDDASDKPVPEATFRFSRNVGIAAAKNKCFELLEDCDHIFLFDDDTYPLVEGWHQPYVASHEPHLMYIFQDFATGTKLNDTIKIYQDSEITAWSHARGCMLYFKRICLDVVGGMDPVFGKWGWEHPNLSERIYNAGLTSFRYSDVTNSAGLFWSADEHQVVQSTVAGPDRSVMITRNRPIYEANRDSDRFVPYKPAAGEDVIITTYFTGQPDPQRGEVWKPDYEELRPLIDSMRGQKLVILHDCFDVADSDTVQHIRVETSLSPYWQRWVSILQYLHRNPTTRRVFCVDGTDVEMLNNPFDSLGAYLYTGDEPEKVDCPWMRIHHPAAFLQSFMRSNANHTLLNAGLLGGNRDVVIAFITKMLRYWADNVSDVHYRKEVTVGDSDMGLFNYTALTFFRDRLQHGQQVNTVFKRFERTGASWFRHK